MKKLGKKIRKNSLKKSLLFLGSMFVFQFLLYLMNLRLRNWVVFILILVILIHFLVGITDFILKKCQNKLEKRITYLVIGFSFLIVLIPCFLLISIFYKPEYSVRLKDKTYVAVLQKEPYVDMAYYDSFGSFIVGIKEKVHAYFEDKDYNPFEMVKGRKVEYTYYDEEEKVTLKESVTWIQNKDGLWEEDVHIIYDSTTTKPSKSEEYLLPEDKEPLYEVQFSSTILRVIQVESVLPQNMAVNVLRSPDNGNNFYAITEEALIVSLEARFVFLNETIGFAISTGNIGLKGNESYGRLFVTQNGGKTFSSSKFNYENNSVHFITVEENPYYENEILKLKCSVYESVLTGGYEEKELLFISKDNGLTWDLEK